MIVKISNGEVTIKTFCSRKVKKAINAALYADVKMEADGKDEEGKDKMKISDLNMQAIARSEDVALVGMTEKIVVDGVDMPVTIETFDEMLNEDVEKVVKEINKITSAQIPLE